MNINELKSKALSEIVDLIVELESIKELMIDGLEDPSFEGEILDELEGQSGRVSAIRATFYESQVIGDFYDNAMMNPESEK